MENNKRKRERSANWSEEEKETLLQLVMKRMKGVDGNSCHGVLGKLKSDAWTEIHKIFVAQHGHRDLNRVKEQWRRMKLSSKSKFHDLQRYQKRSGSPLNHTDQIELDQYDSSQVDSSHFDPSQVASGQFDPSQVASSQFDQSQSTISTYETALLAIKTRRIEEQMILDRERHDKQICVLEEERKYWETKNMHESAISEAKRKYWENKQ